MLDDKDRSTDDIKINEEDQKLDEELASYKAKVAELEEKVLRLLADNQNMRKICDREKADISKFCISDFAKNILIIRDNLTLALSNCSNDDPIIKGLQLTLSELNRVLESYGIKLIEALGAAFDPNYHQALLEIEDEKKQPGIVVQVMQDGFTIYDRLLRPALVGVSKKCN